VTEITDDTQATKTTEIDPEEEAKKRLFAELESQYMDANTAGTAEPGQAVPEPTPEVNPTTEEQTAALPTENHTSTAPTEDPSQSKAQK